MSLALAANRRYVDALNGRGNVLLQLGRDRSRGRELRECTCARA